MSLGIGIIGCGRVVQTIHLEALTRVRDARIVALADPDPANLARARERVPGAAAYSTHEALLESADVHAVVICTPNALHASVAVAAMRLGKHVYLEKPIATTVPDARGVVSAWRQSGVVGSMGFNYRFNPLYVAAGRHVQAGTLGHIVAVRSVFSTGGGPNTAWKKSRELGGGALLDLASHHIDLFHFFFGQRVAGVSCRTVSSRGECDSAILELRLEGGVKVQTFVSTSSVNEDRVEIYGEEAKLTVDRLSSWNVEISRPDDGLSHVERWTAGLRRFSSSPILRQRVLAPTYEPSFQLALQHFVDSALAGQGRSPDLSDGFRSLAVVEAAEEAARTDRIVAPVARVDPTEAGSQRLPA